MARFENQIIRIAELGGDEDSLNELEFEDCEILGPAVLIPISSSFEECTFEGAWESIIWDIQPGSQPSMLGGIRLEECVFKTCTFRRVGLGLGPMIKQRFVEAIEQSQRQAADEPVAG